MRSPSSGAVVLVAVAMVLAPAAGGLPLLGELRKLGEALAPPELLEPSDFTYLGAFRVPQDAGLEGRLASRFAYGGYAPAYRPDGDGGNGSLFLRGHDWHQLVAEISLAEPVRSPRVEDLHTARFLQPFADVSHGLAALPAREGGGPMKLGGMLVHRPPGALEPRLLFSYYRWYNVAGANHPSHGAASLDLAHEKAAGLWYIGPYHIQRTGGYLAAVPEVWQAAFGFPLLTGQSALAGRATSSEGPAAFGFRPWGLAGEGFPAYGSTVEAEAFLWYDVAHPLNVVPQDWRGANAVTGMVFPVAGAKSAVIFFGRVGLYHEDWYGIPDDFPGPDPPCEGGKGYHAPPYQAVAWFYDPRDLLRVRDGVLEPWAPVPYAVWNLKPLLYPSCGQQLGGATYDEENRRLFVVQYGVDPRSPWEALPVVHVFQVGAR